MQTWRLPFNCAFVGVAPSLAAQLHQQKLLNPHVAVGPPDAAVGSTRCLCSTPCFLLFAKLFPFFARPDELVGRACAKKETNSPERAPPEWRSRAGFGAGGESTAYFPAFVPSPGRDAGYFLCCAFPRPIPMAIGTAWRTWTPANTFSGASSKVDWVVSIEDPVPIAVTKRPFRMCLSPTRLGSWKEKCCCHKGEFLVYCCFSFFRKGFFCKRTFSLKTFAKLILSDLPSQSGPTYCGSILMFQQLSG